MKGAFRVTSNLKQWCAIKNWSQEKLAKELQCDKSLISQWFSGKRHPSWQMLGKLCWMTGLDVSDLITFDKTPKKRSLYGQKRSCKNKKSE